MAQAIEREEGWSDFWGQLTDNLARGWSWSGFERSAFFVNRGGARFVELGTVLGADQISDGRGLAAGDLDGDGDLDLVGTCSGGRPEVYVLRNDFRTKRHFLLVDVLPQGRRSAAGARLLLHSASRIQRRDVSLGSGFLTQHATTQHFGLGADEEVERLEIRWPGGEVESRDLARVDGRLVVRQAEDELEWLALQRRNYNATYRLPEIEWDAESSNLRLVPRPGPDLGGLELVDLDGTRHALALGAQALAPDGPILLLNLWASWCANCKAEMPELIEAHDTSRAGLRVLGISLDEPEAEGDVRRAVSDWGLTFPVVHLKGAERERFMEELDSLLSLEGGLALPTSLVLGPQGRVAALARGRIQIAALARYLESVKAAAK